jgi:hypothetical protein
VSELGMGLGFSVDKHLGFPVNIYTQPHWPCSRLGHKAGVLQARLRVVAPTV